MAAYIRDDCTLPRSYCCIDSQRSLTELNRQFKLVEECGEIWQFNLVSEKTQAMVISRFPAAFQAISERVCFGGNSLPLQDHVKMLGVYVD